MPLAALSALREFLVGRGEFLEVTIQESTQQGNPSGKDISGASLSVVFRAWQDGADSSYIKNVTMTKQTTTSTAGDGGVASGYIPAFAVAQAGFAVWCEVVLVDTGAADANTPSGSREYRLRGGKWLARVVDTATT